MAEDKKDFKSKYEFERERRLQVEEENREKEALLAGEHDRMLEIEGGLVSQAEALTSIEQQHIKVLRHELKSEHQKRVAVEKERDEIARELEKSEGKIEACESSVGELEKEMSELERELTKKEKIVGKLSEHENQVDVVSYDGLESWEVDELEKVREIVGRIGTIKKSEVSEMFKIEDDSMQTYIQKLKEKGFVEVMHESSGDPMLKATLKLVSLRRSEKKN